MFSAELSSGQAGGNGTSVRLSGSLSLRVVCQPALSRMINACAPAVTARPISSTWGPGAGAVDFLSWPTDRPNHSFARPASRPGTKSRSGYLAPACSRSARPARGSFFKSCDGLSILGRMPGPGADMRKAQFLENTSQPYFGEINAEAFPEHPFQIHAAPASHPVLLRIGSCLNKLTQFLFLLVRKSRPAPRWLDVDETIGPLRIEAVHPVAQRLAIHTPNASRLLAIHPFQYCRNRQQPPHLIGVLHPPR